MITVASATSSVAGPALRREEKRRVSTCPRVVHEPRRSIPARMFLRFGCVHISLAVGGSRGHLARRGDGSRRLTSWAAGLTRSPRSSRRTVISAGMRPVRARGAPRTRNLEPEPGTPACRKARPQEPTEPRNPRRTRNPVEEPGTSQPGTRNRQALSFRAPTSLPSPRPSQPTAAPGPPVASFPSWQESVSRTSAPSR